MPKADAPMNGRHCQSTEPAKATVSQCTHRLSVGSNATSIQDFVESLVEACYDLAHCNRITSQADEPRGSDE
jgi:hypothetical protein